MTILTNTYSASSANAAYASSTQSSNGSHPTFSEEMYSDPEMRPYLEQYYEKAYAPMRERIAAMREDGYTPKTLQTEDGGVAQEISADQYEAMIPDFDKWLEGQKTIIPGLHDSVDIFRESAQRHVDYLEKHHPDSQSDVRAVFSNGDQILGYLYENGGMVTHDRGSHLRTYSDQADKLGLRGQARVDYIADAISRDYSSIDVSRYDDQNAPTRREFSERWYPDHDVDQGYQANLQEARSQLAAAEERYRQRQSNITEMHGYLLGLMEKEQQA